MRYLGNKDSILDEIKDLLASKKLLEKEYVFFDAFCGTGSVADYFKGYYDIIINDNLNWAVTYTKGRICAPNCNFEKLGFDPFEYLNSNTDTVKGFIYRNYSPEISDRMYFTPENAARIDFFRNKIEEWKNAKLLSEEEYCYLIASLIDSVSSVSNTAGVYGAFLKKWDSRALKNISFNKVEFNHSICKSLESHTYKIEDIIDNIDCDILYLDPPYTQNQYGTQYHLLETLVLNDEPELSKVTGSRSTAPMRSDWSKEYKANILLDKILARTNAKYILLSYNNAGLMSKEYIESALKRYGKPESFICKKIEYKKYQNWKSQNKNKNFEYLFFIEKKEASDIIYESPLNYIGSKAKIVSDLFKYQPPNYNLLIDAFGGGFNVGINAPINDVIYNDLNYLVTELISSFRKYDTYDYIKYVKRTIKKFNLEKGNSETYKNVRAYYNKLPQSKRDPRLLFTIIMYGYQQQIRFNSSHEFNNPVGMRWFNDKILEKLISFSRKIKENNYSFYSKNYFELVDNINESTFVYFDPPYNLTMGSYNDGKRGFNGWNKNLESELFNFADQLNDKGIPFMLSYIVEHKGIVNCELLDWVNRKGYNVIDIGEIIGISGSKRKEVIIINYEV